MFSLQILFSFFSTITRVAAYIDSERLEKDTTWTSQSVGSVLFSCLFFLILLQNYQLTHVCTCALWSEGFQSWMWRGLTFLLPFLFLGHVSLILCLLILGYFAINAIILHGQTAHFLFCGKIIVVKTSSVAQRAICQLKAVIL